jgi:hypothetical protein
MNTIARITAFILIFLGILIILGGLGLGVTGAVRTLMNTTSATPPLRAGGSIGLIAIIFIFVEGITVTAFGEGLYLLADLTNKFRPA